MAVDLNRPLPVGKGGQQRQDYSQQQKNLNEILGMGSKIQGIYGVQGGSKSAAPSPFGAPSPMVTPSAAPVGPAGGGSLMADAKAGLTTTSTVIQNALTAQAAKYYGGAIADPMVDTGQGVYSAGQQAFSKVPLSQLASQWYTMDQASKDKFEAQLAMAGYKTETFSDADLGNLWASYAGQAAAYNEQGRNLTLWDVLAMDAKNHQTAKPVTTTHTDVSTNVSNYQDTHALFMSAAQSLLGRAPTAAETKSFQKTLNAYQQANPTKTTQTSTTDAMGNTSSTTSTSGGTTQAGLTDLAQQAAQQNPDYGAYQAATTYFNALLGAIGHM